MNFQDISYLESGNVRQRALYLALIRSQILERLQEFEPVVVSTICIDIDTDASDVDIICSFESVQAFREAICRWFGSYAAFRWGLSSSSESAVVADFECEGFVFEVYGDTVPVCEQNAYRHLNIMSKILALADERLRADVRALKSEGMKSEAAFCQCLKIEGDPYGALLQLEGVQQIEMRNIIMEAGYRLRTL